MQKGSRLKKKTKFSTLRKGEKVEKILLQRRITIHTLNCYKRNSLETPFRFGQTLNSQVLLHLMGTSVGRYISKP